MKVDYSCCFSVIVQGPVKDNTFDILTSMRAALPEAQIIFSTWTFDPKLNDLVDDYVVNEDPGCANLFVEGTDIKQYENSYRQLLSFRRGLSVAKNEFCIKWRSDFAFNFSKFKRFLTKKNTINMMVNNIVFVSSVTTANPYSGVRLVGHISDWYLIGKKELLDSYVLDDYSILPLADKTISREVYDKIRFPIDGLTAEQKFLLPVIESRLGSLNSPSDIDKTSKFVELFICDFNVLSPSKLGVVTFKYDHFIYPKIKTLSLFIGHFLTSITSFECFLLRIPFVGNSIGRVSLKIKGQVYALWRKLKHVE